MPKPTSAPPGLVSVDSLLQQGLALHQAGRAEEAAKYYERVLAREPRQPAANHLLGLVFLSRGDPKSAVTHIARAVAARPGEAQYLGNLGVALNAAGQHEEAIEVLSRAVGLRPDFAEAHSNLGMACRELGRHEEAAAAYRQAIRIRPAEAGFHYNLGNALAASTDILPAEAAYREALRLRPGYGVAAYALGSLLDEEGRYAEGLAIVDAAMVAVRNDPQLLTLRGNLLRHLGRLEEALSSYDRALQARPAHGEAHWQRATLHRHAQGDPAVAAMRAVLADQRVPADDRVRTGFALGKALGDIGEHPQSVTAYLAANRLQREQQEFSIERALDDLRLDLNRAVDLPPPAPGRPAGLIFVVGLPRSGKSTVESILSLHPGVAPVRELPTLQRLYDRLLAEAPGKQLAQQSPERLSALGEAYLIESRQIAGGDGRVTVDTMPLNYRLVGLIAAALPDARIIWCHRDPVEHRIAILEKYLPGRGHEYASDPDDLARFHAAYVETMQAWQVRLPGHIRLVDVAELRRNRDAATRELLAYCGLDWNDACLADSESEPQLGEWGPGELAANRIARRAAWAAARPDLFGTK